MNTRNTVLVTALIFLLVGIAAGIAAVYSGFYNVAADDPHTQPVYAVLEAARNRSIAVRSSNVALPKDLADEARIRQGAGNYDAMCAGCHLAPGLGETELSEGLYPAPPNLTRRTVAPAEAFWIIKHGIKASGMAAWGRSMSDEYVWNMTAFLQRLPKLDEAAYRALVASSGGHSHGGGESDGHVHGAEPHDEHHHDDAHNDHEETAGTPEAAETPATKVHVHADGTPHVHSIAPAPKPADSDDAHEHEH
jgi:mono/diheme cytochrome c family protein